MTAAEAAIIVERCMSFSFAADASNRSRVGMFRLTCELHLRAFNVKAQASPAERSESSAMRSLLQAGVEETVSQPGGVWPGRNRSNTVGSHPTAPGGCHGQGVLGRNLSLNQECRRVPG